MFYRNGTLALLVAATLHASASAQVPGAPKTTPLEDTGTIEAVYPGVLTMHDSKNALWRISLAQQPIVEVTGTAEVEFLRPGQFVRLLGTVNKKNELKEEISQLEVFTPSGKGAVGFFSTQEGANTRPLRKPGPGHYEIRGRINSFKNGLLTISAGSKKVVGQLAAEPTIMVSVDDVNYAQSGDEVRVKGWYYPAGKANATFDKPGVAMAEEVTIKMVKPLTAMVKGRAAKRKQSQAQQERLAEEAAQDPAASQAAQ